MNGNRESNKRREAAEFRYSIGADVLLAMNRNHDLPLPNKQLVAEIMQKYYKRDGHEDSLIESGYRWRGSVAYWHNHLEDVRRVLRDRNRPFEFIPDKDDNIMGQWKFPNEREQDRRLRQRYNEIRTRSDNFNDERNGSKKKWDNLAIPTLPEVPLLEEESRNPA